MRWWFCIPATFLLSLLSPNLVAEEKAGAREERPRQFPRTDEPKVRQAIFFVENEILWGDRQTSVGRPYGGFRVHYSYADEYDTYQLDRYVADLARFGNVWQATLARSRPFKIYETKILATDKNACLELVKDHLCLEGEFKQAIGCVWRNSPHLRNSKN